MRQFIILCLAAGIAAGQQREPGKGVNFYSLEKEIALGRQIAGDFQRDHRLIEDAAVVSYINDLGQRLVKQIGGPPFVYTFAVFADRTPYSEAVGLPGGFVYVPSSLILAAKDEDELAGILAHSVAHIASRDSTKQATKAELVNIASQPLVFMGGWTGNAIRMGADLALPLAFMKSWRAFELAADRLAAAKLPGVGYDPAALARYIDREQKPFDEWQSARQFSALPAR